MEKNSGYLHAISSGHLCAAKHSLVSIGDGYNRERTNVGSAGRLFSRTTQTDAEKSCAPLPRNPKARIPRGIRSVGFYSSLECDAEDKTLGGSMSWLPTEASGHLCRDDGQALRLFLGSENQSTKGSPSLVSGRNTPTKQLPFGGCDSHPSP